jgi:phenylacetate-CoA ligase
VHAYPSSAAALAELIAPAGLELRVRAVLLASEPATRQQLAAIAGLFGCPVSISYGLTERTNLAFANHRQGITGPYRFEPLYAVNENRIAGGRCEIVGTSLGRLVRHRRRGGGRHSAGAERQAAAGGQRGWFRLVNLLR